MRSVFAITLGYVCHQHFHHLLARQNVDSPRVRYQIPLHFAVVVVEQKHCMAGHKAEIRKMQ
jgi:hypothetical protein